MKVIVLSSQALTLVNYRRDMICEMIAHGHEVIAVAPEEDFREEIESWGARYEVIPADRTSTNPIHDIIIFFKYLRLYIKEKPDITFNYLVKPVVYGSLAARIAGVKNIYSMIAGLGSLFVEERKHSIVQKIVRIMYKMSLPCCNRVFFQNHNDIEEFVRTNIVNKENAILVNGSGVNMERYTQTPLPSSPIFLLMARLIWDKGIKEYIEAAQIVKEKYPYAKFQLLGPFDINPTAIQPSELQTYIDNGIIEYLGETRDVRPYLNACSIYVLPSKYREGVPHSILEALAMGRPVITTDSPGCRETVEEGKNGLLVKTGDSKMLAEKMIWMIEHPNEWRRMGQESYNLCREKFDVRMVNKTLLDSMGLL